MFRWCLSVCLPRSHLHDRVKQTTILMGERRARIMGSECAQLSSQADSEQIASSICFSVPVQNIRGETSKVQRVKRHKINSKTPVTTPSAPVH